MGANNRADDLLIEVEDLRKTFTIGLFQRRRVAAVRGVSFAVKRGDIVGYLGPNGSGKTTTIKMLLGLIAPSSGSARMFGVEVPSRAARARIGFLPENPYVYPHLTPREFVAMSGRLSGVSGAPLKRRTEEVLDATGVLYAADREVRRLSKGMLQRSALAAALVADPEMLILDEPMSGLDPVGRKQVRDLLVRERDNGRTIFFCTHILGDVETLCDHVIIMRQGRVVVSGELRQLLRSEVRTIDIAAADCSDALRAAFEQAGHGLRSVSGTDIISVEGNEAAQRVLQQLLAGDAQVLEVNPHRETLEDLFMRQALGPSD